MPQWASVLPGPRTVGCEGGVSAFGGDGALYRQLGPGSKEVDLLTPDSPNPPCVVQWWREASRPSLRFCRCEGL